MQQTILHQPGPVERKNEKTAHEILQGNSIWSFARIALPISFWHGLFKHARHVLVFFVLTITYWQVTPPAGLSTIRDN